jgi:hypothetical protein
MRLRRSILAASVRARSSGILRSSSMLSLPERDL